MTLPYADIAQWGRFEQTFMSTRLYANPFQDVRGQAVFTSPTGRLHTVDLFWNGGQEWRIRFMPDEVGVWQFTVTCSDETNHGLHQNSGQFTCSASAGLTRFDRHGRLQLSDNRHHLVHADGTPFFWLGDTAWNGPLLSTPEEWSFYLTHRKRQQFTAVQWVATQWISAPDGDWVGELAYSGHERILVHPSFFQRLDQKLVALNRAGLLSVPVMLWAATWSTVTINARNPGYTLPEEQAILLARYMVARWGAFHTVWLLPGDGHYTGEVAARWRRIGQAVFGDQPRELVGLHPGGLLWPMDEFRHEEWLSLAGYQSGHSDHERALTWLTEGPPSHDWQQEPIRPVINLEPPYEDHRAGEGRRHSDHSVRRALYWSLLVAPTAGVSYGGHGIWGWDDGSAPPIGHEQTGTPLPWQQALMLPAAEQLAHLKHIMLSLDWWRLRPAQEVLSEQPGNETKRYFIAAARTDNTLLLYLPENHNVRLRTALVHADGEALWLNPRTGGTLAAQAQSDEESLTFITPEAGDWLLRIQNAFA